MKMKRLTVIVSIMVMSCGLCLAASSIVAPVEGKAAYDILTDYAFGGFDLVGDQIVGWAGGSLKVFDIPGGTSTDLGMPSGYSAYNSFVRQDPSGSSAWVGFTVMGNTDDRIYQVDYATGTWTQKAALAGNFDLEFYNSTPFVTATNSTNWQDPTCVWALDSTGSDNHDKIIEMNGTSAGLAFDTSGNLYYASGYGATELTLYKWDGADVQNSIGAGNLTYLDGTKLSDLEATAYDIDIDDAGNVIFNGNGLSSFTAMWNGTAGDGMNYEKLSVGALTNNWHSFIDSVGDVSADDGAYYQADGGFGVTGIAVVVPEPATLAIIGIGAVLVRRRKA